MTLNTNKKAQTKKGKQMLGQIILIQELFKPQKQTEQFKNYYYRSSGWKALLLNKLFKAF